MTNIKVSVLTPIYNTNLEYLKEAIESILLQSFKDFEFIILNDSPENTHLDELVNSYDDSRIIYLKNEKNIGITKSRNKLIDLARGEYLAVFDHDDISLPTRLEKQVNFLDKNEDIGVVGCNTQWFPSNELHIHPENNLDIKRSLMSVMIVAHTSAMIRKSVIINNNIRYEEFFSPAEDYMLMIRLVGKTMFYNIQEILVKYRFDGTNTTFSQFEKMRDKDSLIRCIAAKEYPYLYLENNKSVNILLNKKLWIKLFFIIPIIKLKKTENKTKIYLFGIVPIFYIKG